MFIFNSLIISLALVIIVKIPRMYTLLLNVAPAIQTRPGTPGSLADTVLQLLDVRPSSISVVVAKFQLPLMPPVTKRTYIHIDIEYTAKNVKGNILATPHDVFNPYLLLVAVGK